MNKNGKKRKRKGKMGFKGNNESEEENGEFGLIGEQDGRTGRMEG